MLWLLALAPLFLVFEICQLVLCERYLGIRQLATGRDPRTLPMGERLAFSWTFFLFLYWVWIGLLLGGSVGRIQALALFLISLGGFLLGASQLLFQKESGFPPPSTISRLRST